MARLIKVVVPFAACSHYKLCQSVLQPRRSGKLRGTEGSRTKAAIGASNYGLAVKISSAGDITIYYKGIESYAFDDHEHGAIQF